MFLVPLKAPLKVMATVKIWESPETVSVVAPMVHWLLERVAVELIGLLLEPAPLS